MKPASPRDQVSRLTDKLWLYLEGVIFGFGLGIIFAFWLVPKDDRKVFPAGLFIVAILCCGLSQFIIPVKDWLRRTISKKSSR